MTVPPRSVPAADGGSRAAAGATPPARPHAPAPSVRTARVSLAWRIFATNAAVLVVAGTALLLTPVTVSHPVTSWEAGILVSGVALSLVANFLLVRWALAPLGRLVAHMDTADVLRPGRRISMDAGTPDVQAIVTAFNRMLERLEDERRESARRALLAQESERLRVGRELHDELGQTLTGVLLQLDGRARAHPGDPDLEEARESARRSLEQVRRIARDLRPDALDDLGLASALTALCARIERHTGIEVRRAVAADLPRLPHDLEVVLYRVAQESLTNVARHADARRVELELERRAADVVLTVADDGCGVSDDAAESSGIRGMRERALLARGDLAIEPRPGGGTRVMLRVPLAAALLAGVGT